MKKVLRKLTLAVAALLGIGCASAETTVLLDADFSEKCTAGTEDNPQMFKYTSDFTSLYSGWSLSSASSLGQAGGSLYIKDGATVRTPYLSGVSTGNGAIKITLEVKLCNTNMGMVQLKWVSSSTFNAEVYTADWTTIEFMVVPTTASSFSNYANIGPYLCADGMFLKSVKIEQSPDFIVAPTTYLPSDANGSSFTARWKAVTGATKYYIDVYSYNAAGDKVMFLENQEVTPTTSTASYIYYKVEGLNPDTTYYYVVRAANDNAVSGDSAEMEVVKIVSSLATPVVKVEAGDGAYTATWDAVADATGYLVEVTCNTVMTEAGLADVLSESFDCFTEGTVENYEYAYQRHLDMLGEPGWTGDNLSYIKGGIGLTPYSKGASYLETPALDLSSNDGKVTVVITGAARKGSSLVAQGTVALALEDEAGNLTEPVDLNFDVAGFSTYTVELTGGTASSKLKITDNNDDTSLRYFFDDITVQQEKPAGYVSTSTYDKADVTATSYSGNVEVKDNTSYYVSVIAYAPTVVSGSVTTIFSEPSEKVVISNNSGVEKVIATEGEEVAVKSLGNGQFQVTAANAVAVSVFDIAGRKLAQFNAAPGVTTLRVNTSGVVIVKAGNTVEKIVL